MPSERTVAGGKGAVLRIEGVSHCYSAGAAALSGVSLSVGEGELVALIGANGSGKSTLLRILAGVLAPTEGRAHLPARSVIAYLSQDLELDPEMTFRETLSLLATLQGVPQTEVPAAIDGAARVFVLGPLLDRRISAASGGQRRRVHVAGGLLHPGARFFFLDEPTAGLDDEGSEVVFSELGGRVQGGAAVVVATHEIERVAARASRVALLDGGRLVECDAPSALLDRHGQSATAAGHPGDLRGVYRHLTGRDVAPPERRGGRGDRRRR
jgi:ABC-2 type transport system ATP-binding protein